MKRYIKMLIDDKVKTDHKTFVGIYDESGKFCERFEWLTPIFITDGDDDQKIQEKIEKRINDVKWVIDGYNKHLGYNIVNIDETIKNYRDYYKTHIAKLVTK